MDYLLAEVCNVQSDTYLLICVWDATKEHASETLQSICSNKPIIDPGIWISFCQSQWEQDLPSSKECLRGRILPAISVLPWTGTIKWRGACE